MPGMQRLLGESKRDRVMDAWSRVAGRIEQATDVLGTVTFYCTLAMVAAGTYNAIMRYLSRWAHIDPESTEGLDPVLYWIGEAARRLSSNTFIELQWYLFSLVFLLGAAYTLRCNAHVRVDVFYNRLTLEKKAWINILGSLLFLMPFCVLMIWTSWPDVIDSWERLEGSPDPGGLPRYPLLTVIPLAFLMLMLQGVAYIIREFAVLYDIAVLRKIARLWQAESEGSVRG